MAVSTAVPLRDVSSFSLADLEAHDPQAPARSPERRFLCPFPACADHQCGAQHRSLTVNTATGAWHCWRCGQTGLLREHWSRHDNQEHGSEHPGKAQGRREKNRQRLRQRMGLTDTCDGLPAPQDDLASCEAKSGVQNSEQQQQQLGQWLQHRLRPLLCTPGAQYLEGRGLPSGFCQAAGVSYSADWFGRPAAVFLVQDESGAAVAAQGRYTDGRTDPKTRSKGRIRQGAFVTPGALSAACLVIVEAPIDALSLALCGVPAVALCGKDNRPQWLKNHCALRKVLLAFDSDEAGDNAAQEASGWLRTVGADVRRLRPDGAKDWNALLLEQGATALRASLHSCLPAEVGRIDSDLLARLRCAQVAANVTRSRDSVDRDSADPAHPHCEDARELLRYVAIYREARSDPEYRNTPQGTLQAHRLADQIEHLAHALGAGQKSLPAAWRPLNGSAHPRTKKPKRQSPRVTGAEPAESGEAAQ